jgi:hypothetical protein
MLHPAPASVKNERTKAVVLDISKQWKALEEARMEHRAQVQQDQQQLEAARTALATEREELAKDMAKQYAAVEELKVGGAGVPLRGVALHGLALQKQGGGGVCGSTF